MINAFLVFNNQGQPRLTKFYTQLDTNIQQRLIAEIFSLVFNRPAGSCNFLPLPPLLAASSGSSSSSDAAYDVPSLVTYRHYATLYFIVISTATESPLALIDLIQVYVEALDRLFENVCELDLIFNFEAMHATLGEMVVGGVVIETNLDRIVGGVRAQGVVAKRPVHGSNSSGGGGSGGGNSGSGLGLATTLGMGSNFVWHGR
ncbi:adaptor protein complex AP-3 small subunit [Niveomyces insectorum RCEF 264]|uniref:Adaptor protein complex AP-3 small subunit n=1 Tax=Niveomyces insectorum RCEF 264 TaxID=1081102 RepID=A0A167NR34_9HYPO|nr:adaptor protein complex AP-3 small subunit [Niveomyces insectorum RCEF 264]